MKSTIKHLSHGRTLDQYVGASGELKSHFEHDTPPTISALDLHPAGGGCGAFHFTDVYGNARSKSPGLAFWFYTSLCICPRIKGSTYRYWQLVQYGGICSRFRYW